MGLSFLIRVYFLLFLMKREVWGRASGGYQSEEITRKLLKSFGMLWVRKEKWQMMEDVRIKSMTVGRGPNRFQVWNAKEQDNKP